SRNKLRLLIIDGYLSYITRNIISLYIDNNINLSSYIIFLLLLYTLTTRYKGI
ncbi:hypothetical protein BJ875DRAFT_375948, partial [Amylocarpus encephaloides]